MKKTYDEIREIILSSLEELGICVDRTETDIDINEYGMDSFVYISLIVELEEKLDMLFPDSLLTFDNFSSINGFANLVDGLINVAGN